MKLNLFRGIAVEENEVESVINDINKKGLYNHPKSDWEIHLKSLKNNLVELFNNPNLKHEETVPSSKFIELEKDGHKSGFREFTEGFKCLCFADELGARYYATIHNITKTNKVPILIEVKVDIEDVFIDSRDFLGTILTYKLFHNIEKQNEYKDVLISLYGNGIEKYIDKIISNPDIKVALSNLVNHDNVIIKDHYLNNSIIGGRFGTKFKSAFFVKSPILPENIINISIIDTNFKIENPDYNIESI